MCAGAAYRADLARHHPLVEDALDLMQTSILEFVRRNRSLVDSDNGEAERETPLLCLWTCSMGSEGRRRVQLMQATSVPCS